jgi:hypothetical protein
MKCCRPSVSFVQFVSLTVIFCFMYKGTSDTYLCVEVIPFYINDINNGAYYRLWNRVNSGLSLEIGFKPGLLCSFMMVRLYRNVGATCLTLICKQ